MKNGFTLPELITTVAMVAIMGGLLIGIMVNNTGLFYQQTSKVSQGVDANDALVRVRSEIKEAQAVAVGYPVGSPTYTSGSNQLVLRLTSIDSSGNIITATYDYAVFAVSEERLTYQFFPDTAGGSIRKGANEILAKNVSSVLFEYYDSTGAQTGPTNAVNVKITLTLRQKAGQGFETNVVTSEANLRNN